MIKTKECSKEQTCPTQSLAASCERDIVQRNITLVLTASNAFNNHLRYKTMAMDVTETSEVKQKLTLARSHYADHLYHEVDLKVLSKNQRDLSNITR